MKKKAQDIEIPFFTVQKHLGNSGKAILNKKEDAVKGTNPERTEFETNIGIFPQATQGEIEKEGEVFRA